MIHGCVVCCVHFVIRVCVCFAGICWDKWINIKISVKKSAHKLFLFSSTSRPSSIWLCLVGKTSQFWLVFPAKLTINWHGVKVLTGRRVGGNSAIHRVSGYIRVLTMHGYRSGANKWYIVPFLSSKMCFWSLWHKIHADKDLLYLFEHDRFVCYYSRTQRSEQNTPNMIYHHEIW